MLGVLKWLGIILLILLGVLFVLLFCILIVPIRYTIEGEYGEKGEKMEVSGCVSWLLHVLHVRFYITGEEQDVKIRIFGFLLKQRKKKERKETSSGKKEKKSTAKTSDKTKDRAESVEQSAIEEKENIRDRKRDTSQTAEDGGNGAPELETTEEKAEEPTGESKPKVKKKSSSGKRKSKKTKGTSKADGIKQLLKDENTGIMWGIVWDCIKRLWKHSRPKKMKGRVHFGLSDPADTGELLGGLSILYAVYGDDLEIVPDFQQEILEGHLQIQGRIQVVVLLLMAKRIFLSREWRRFKKQLDRL